MGQFERRKITKIRTKGDEKIQMKTYQGFYDNKVYV